MARRQRMEFRAGDQYGEWTVIREVAPRANRQRMVLCRCSCGAEHEVYAGALCKREKPSRRCQECGTSNGGKVGGSRANLPGIVDTGDRLCRREVHLVRRGQPCVACARFDAWWASYRPRTVSRFAQVRDGYDPARIPGAKRAARERQRDKSGSDVMRAQIHADIQRARSGE